jgi:hypothetical protein
MQQRGVRLLDAGADEADEDRTGGGVTHRASLVRTGRPRRRPVLLAVRGQDADARMLLNSSRSAPL